MRQETSTLNAAIADPLGFRFRPRLSLYLHPSPAAPLAWAWADSDTPVHFDIAEVFAGDGLDPTSLEVTLYSSSQVIDGSSIEQAALGAAAPFRGKRLVLELLIATSAGEEPFCIFDGQVTQVRASTSGVTLMATGAMSSADRRQGTLEVGLSCPWVLYGSDCGATRTNVNHTALTGSTAKWLLLQRVAGFSPAPGDLVQVPSGETARVRSAAGNATEVAYTLDRPVTPPAAGSTVVVTPGCRKFLADCRDRHHNEGRFGGCPARPIESITSGA